MIKKLKMYRKKKEGRVPLVTYQNTRFYTAELFRARSLHSPTNTVSYGAHAHFFLPYDGVLIDERSQDNSRTIAGKK